MIRVYSMTVSQAFAVKVGDFEGPLDVLLHLIEERKMLISDVSLTNVSDDFLKFIGAQTSFPLGQATQFVLIAATLLLLKSKALLPVLTLTDDEQGDIKDLEFRLTLYRQFKIVAKALSQLGGSMFIGEGATVSEPLFMPSRDLSVQNLADAASRVIEQAPKALLHREVSVKRVISLEDMMETLAQRIEKAAMMTFREFSGNHAKDRYDVVVGFLAMLELVKRGLMLARQDMLHGDITMSYTGTMKAPSYD